MVRSMETAYVVIGVLASLGLTASLAAPLASLAARKFGAEFAVTLTILGVLAGVLVRLREVQSSGLSDANGVYTINGLAPGMYTLFFEKLPASAFCAEREEFRIGSIHRNSEAHCEVTLHLCCVVRNKMRAIRIRNERSDALQKAGTFQQLFR